MHRGLTVFKSFAKVGNQATVHFSNNSSTVAVASSTDSRENMEDCQSDRMRHSHYLRQHTCSRQWPNSYRTNFMVSSSGRHRGTTQVSKNLHTVVLAPSECIRNIRPQTINMHNPSNSIWMTDSSGNTLQFTCNTHASLAKTRSLNALRRGLVVSNYDGGPLLQQYYHRSSRAFCCHACCQL